MTQCEEIVEHILPELESRPSESESKLREDSWMTTEEIRHILQFKYSLSVSSEELEACLITQENKTPRLIRSAKYPHTTMLVRLWVHVAKVGAGSPDLTAMTRTDKPLRIDGIDLFVGAPQVFISYASQDAERAVELGRGLSAQRITAWLYELAIEKDDLIFEGVRAALRRSNVLLALITPFSIASLWVRTEASSATIFGVPVRLAVPTDCVDLVTLLAQGDPVTHWEETRDLIRPLEAIYVQHSTRTRIEKYSERVNGFLPNLLRYAHERPIVIIGAPPRDWLNVFKMVSLETFASELLVNPGAKNG